MSTAISVDVAVNPFLQHFTSHVGYENAKKSQLFLCKQACEDLQRALQSFIVFDAKKRRLKLSVKELLRHHHPNGKFLPSDEEGNYPPSLSLKFLNVPVCI